MNELALVFSGFFVGLTVGLTGVGGGSLMTPLLIFGFGMQSYIAVGTDLLFAAVTKLTGSVYSARARLIDWRIVRNLSLGSIPAALTTVIVLNHFGAASTAVENAINTALGLALILTAASTLYKTWYSRNSRTHKIHEKTPDSVAVQAALQPAAPHWISPVLLGAILGCLVALTSVGAGAIGVGALILLYPHLPLPRIIAIDIAYAVPLTLVAGLGHAAIDSVHWATLFFLLLGSIPGILLGGRCIHQAPERFIRSILSLLLAGAGLKLLNL